MKNKRNSAVLIHYAYHMINYFKQIFKNCCNCNKNTDIALIKRYLLKVNVFSLDHPEYNIAEIERYRGAYNIYINIYITNTYIYMNVFMKTYRHIYKKFTNLITEYERRKKIS